MMIGEWCNPNCIWVLIADVIIAVICIAFVWAAISWALEKFAAFLRKRLQ